jgi:MoxR-like ATPase|tara:strand:+ start:1872 stop:2600 length:729 start_codon:yes stop_codon:yes gene_type:complete
MDTDSEGNLILPDCWQTLTDAIAAGIDRIVLYGPPGTGKTFAGLTMGDTSAGAWRLVCTEDMTNGDVTGSFMPNSDGSFSWVSGAALKAWGGNGTAGGRLIADEIDKAGGDVAATLLAMLDGEDSASWEHPETGRIHRPLPGFSAIMTTNIENMEELPPALLDRFPVRVRIDQPHPHALMLLSKDLRGMAVQMADADDRRISLRTLMAFDKIRKTHGADRAAVIVFGKRAQDILDGMKVEAV